MVLLDSDHMSLIQRGGSEGRRIWQRLRTLAPDDVAVSVVSYEEQTRGWLARIAKASNLERLTSDYRELKQLLQDYCNIAVIDFDVRAALQYQQLRMSRIRVATMDMRIAAIALANDAIVLTRNVSDFSKVHGLRVEDWSK
jgi:tRNA(fMet)-specific endonuclease VapC